MKKIADFFKKTVEVFKKPHWLLCLGIGFVVFGSIFANTVNTSGYQVKVSEVKMETGEGKHLTALRYAPKSCSEDKKCATIITTHGYLNSKEMQDEAAIELSKRGYIVYALDMYEHGDSSASGMDWGYYMIAQSDAAKWVYDNEKALLKASDGTGMIGVGGHSMGGFSSRMAAYQDEKEHLEGAPQKIVAMLSMGADYRYIPYDVNDTITKMGNRTSGTLAGRYDEFFFTSDCKLSGGKAVCSYGNKGTVTEKDWGKHPEGKATYYNVSLEAVMNNPENYEDVKSGVWNDDVEGGRVIYRPNEIHPWNHFSIESTGYQIDFYNTAFEKQFAIHNVTEANGKVVYGEEKAQSWWLKEGFEFIGLIGIFISIVATLSILAKAPFFSKAVTDAGEINEVVTTKGPRTTLVKLFTILSCFATAWVFPMMNLGTTSAYTSSLKAIMGVAGAVLVAALITHIVLKATDKENEKSANVLTNVTVGAITIFVTGFFSYWTMTKNFFSDMSYYNEPGTTTIAKWALVSAGLTMVALSISYFLSNKKDGYTLANYGLKANLKQIGIALLGAILIVFGVYAVTFLVEYLLRVDFRIWTYAIKPFGIEAFKAFFKYLPVFFLFYLVSGISIIGSTGKDKTWKGTLKAMGYASLAVALVLGLHYGMDFVTGTAKFPTLALDMILVFALVPTLAISAWIVRKSYFKTGNIWLGVFINAILFTLVQVANTCIFM